jgi:hypothetical protein
MSDGEVRASAVEGEGEGREEVILARGSSLDILYFLNTKYKDREAVSTAHHYQYIPPSHHDGAWRGSASVDRRVEGLYCAVPRIKDHAGRRTAPMPTEMPKYYIQDRTCVTPRWASALCSSLIVLYVALC